VSWRRSSSDARKAWEFTNQTLDRGATALVDVAMGAKTGKDAFKEFATSVIRDIGTMIAKFILLNTVIKPLFGAFMGGGGGAGGLLSAFFGFSQGGSMSFASGGSFTVPGGSSMTDNQMIPISVASGERVTVDRPGVRRRSGGLQSC
jgi:lambda family phage tail tape measure protein